MSKDDKTSGSEPADAGSLERDGSASSGMDCTILCVKYETESESNPVTIRISAATDSFQQAMEDYNTGRTAPMWAVLYLPRWLVNLIWFRRQNTEATNPRPTT